MGPTIEGDEPSYGGAWKGEEKVCDAGKNPPIGELKGEAKFVMQGKHS